MLRAIWPQQEGLVGEPRGQSLLPVASSLLTEWPRGVTLSTLDSESSDRGSNRHKACDPCSAIAAALQRNVRPLARDDLGKTPQPSRATNTFLPLFSAAAFATLDSPGSTMSTWLLGLVA